MVAKKSALNRFEGLYIGRTVIEQKYARKLLDSEVKMATGTIKKIQLARYILLVCFMPVCEMQLGNLKKMNDPNTQDHDVFFEENEKCFWHIYCDMKLFLRVKELIDIFTIADLNKIFERNKDPRIMETLIKFENIRNATFWEKVIQPRMCRSESDKMEFTRTLSPEYLQYCSDICYNPMTVQECSRAMEVTDGVYQLLVEYEAKGECVLTQINKDFLPH